MTSAFLILAAVIALLSDPTSRAPVDRLFFGVSLADLILAIAFR